MFSTTSQEDSYGFVHVAVKKKKVLLCFFFGFLQNPTSKKLEVCEATNLHFFFHSFSVCCFFLSLFYVSELALLLNMVIFSTLIPHWTVTSFVFFCFCFWRI